jgi:glycopeptide antibiotics resistance protein
MLKDYLIPIETAAVVFFVVAAVLLIPICLVHYRRFGYLKPPRAIVFYTGLFYSFCAFCLVTLPLPVITPDFCETHTLAKQMRLVPFQFVIDILRVNHVSLRHLNVVSILESKVFLQAFFNFLLLMPLGFYLRYYFHTSRRVAATIALGTTLMFEVTQITGIYGYYPCPYRTFDVDDLMLNASGAMVGYAIMPMFHDWLPDLQKAYPKPRQVAPFRRFVAFAIDWFLANSLTRVISYTAWSATSETHPLWLDLVVYGAWFIGIPLLWRGQTVGKNLVRVRLTRLNGNPVKATQLCIRYTLLLLLPITTEAGFTSSQAEHFAQNAYGVNGFALIFFSLLILQITALVGLVLWRKDHRGFHEVVAKTWHQLT